MLPAWLLAFPPILFAAATGACVGSFLNVVAYRLPRNEGLFRPGSRCPSCETPLTWRENLPILGWLFLRGRCRFCRSPVSPEYPIVELALALLFAGLVVDWFLPTFSYSFNSSASAPEWSALGLARMWPTLALFLLLISSLIAMSLIDARTYTIPPIIPWLVALIAFITHPLHALTLSSSPTPLIPDSDFPWTLPTPRSTTTLLITLAASLGLLLSNILVWTGLLKRSFHDFEAWLASASSSPSTPPPPPTPLRAVLFRTLLFTAPAIVLMGLGAIAGSALNAPTLGMGVGLVLGLILGTLLRARVSDTPTPSPTPTSADTPPSPPTPSAPAQPRRYTLLNTFLPPLILSAAAFPLSPTLSIAAAGLGLILSVLLNTDPEPLSPTPDAATPPHHEPSFLDYPHARRETVRELLFLAPPILAAVLATTFTPQLISALPVLASPPLWLLALTGSLLGFIVGGAVIWAVRILGTLAIGREAMGLGDVHLLAAVGAICGWIDPVLAFFTAPLLALPATAASAIARKGVRSALPFGPHLALASIAVILAKPAFEALLSFLLHSPVDLP